MTLRVGLVGCGAIARRAHLPAFKAAGSADVVAFNSRSRASAEAAAEEWGSGRVEDDWQDLVTAGDVDAIDICSPNRVHAEVAIAAAEAGKHVLVEKPMACTVAEADAMLAAAAGNGVVLSVAHNLRYFPAFWTARQAVADGTVGEVVGFRSAFGHGGPKEWAPEARWFYDPALSGGGALIDLGIHVADLLRFVLADDAAEVSALLTPLSAGIDAAAHVVMRMTSGVVGTFHASWNTRPGPEHVLTIFGTEGTLHLDRRTPLTVLRPNGETAKVPTVDASPGLYDGWLGACLGDGPVPVSGQDGRAALAIVEAAYLSAATGRVVNPA